MIGYGKTAMLKISLVENRTCCLLVLEGKLIAPWTVELRAACEKARADLRNRELVVDLKHITAISQEGENVLCDLMNQQVKFRGRGVFTKQILRQVAHRARKKL
jgi:anti-anti-sigma regulatory factor